MIIPFNKPAFTGKEPAYILEAIQNEKLSGNGKFTVKCCELLEKKIKSSKIMLTTSCTHALEISAMLADIKPDDEVILPSYTFTSTANAFVLRGAKLVFVDIRKDTMNIDEKLIEGAITKRTRVIVPVHYAGVACEMDEIMAIAKKHGLFVVEDAAQGVMSRYRGRYLGSIGDFGCFSFHDTKNYTCGEGGAILIKDKKYVERAEIIWEKGTNRHKFFRGEVDKYSWVDIGSSYLPAEINAAYLLAQLESAAEINVDRHKSWNRYYESLESLMTKGLIELPFIPGHCEHNAHMFYIKTANLNERSKLIHYLKQKKIVAIFHYVPLHSSEAGKKFGRFFGEDNYTTKESDKLLRLPMFYKLPEKDIDHIVKNIKEFYGA